MRSEKQRQASRANGARSRGPTTPAGKAASAANSAQSTGPVTPQGKARSARNAIRHGMLAYSTVLETESVELFNEIIADYHQELQPVTPIEIRYVETMAAAEWRRLRAICIQKAQLTAESRRQEDIDIDSAVASTPGADLPDPTPEQAAEPIPHHYTAQAIVALCRESDAQELISRHENRYERQFQRALNGFYAHRERRLKAEQRRTRDARRRKPSPSGWVPEPLPKAS